MGKASSRGGTTRAARQNRALLGPLPGPCLVLAQSWLGVTPSVPEEIGKKTAAHRAKRRSRDPDAPQP